MLRLQKLRVSRPRASVISSRHVWEVLGLPEEETTMDWTCVAYSTTGPGRASDLLMNLCTRAGTKITSLHLTFSGQAVRRLPFLSCYQGFLKLATSQNRAFFRVIEASFGSAATGLPEKAPLF